VALDASSEGVFNAHWQLLAGTRDAKGLAAWLPSVDTMPVTGPGGLIVMNSMDSTTIAHQDDFFEMVRRKATSKAERNEMANSRALVLLNRGRAAEAGRWLDTLGTVTPGSDAVMRLLSGVYGGGPGLDTTRLRPEQVDYWRLSQGDTIAGKRVVAVFRERAAADTLHRGWYAIAPIAEAMLAVSRGDPKALQLVDHADSLWVGREGNQFWASIQLARLYEAQGRTDRALRAVRRRWQPLGQPAIQMLAESYRLEGQLAAKLGDRQAAIAAYKNYLRLRFDPDSSRIPQRDSVRAEYAAIADVEKQKQ
jgi:tetratricopeptide (TPR) repeat protein